MSADLASIVSAVLGSEERARQAEKRAALAEERVRHAEGLAGVARAISYRHGMENAQLLNRLSRIARLTQEAYHIAEEIDQRGSGETGRNSLAEQVRNLMVEATDVADGYDDTVEDGASDEAGSAAQ